MKNLKGYVGAVVAAILLLFGGIIGNALAAESKLSSEGLFQYPETSIYSAHIIMKANDYVDLQQWIHDNYSDAQTMATYYLPNTMEAVTMYDGSDAIKFETWQYDRFVLNTLVDKGNKIALYSISDPNFNAMEFGNSTDYLPVIGKAKSSASSCDNKYKCNCVLWVRNCRANWLPTGMTYIWEKKTKINTQKADKNRVAVMDIYYPYGHVAYITKVSGSKISVQEANYSSCKVTSRTGTKSGMKIAGYIKK
jgi:hypothetical protein